METTANAQVEVPACAGTTGFPAGERANSEQLLFAIITAIALAGSIPTGGWAR